MSTPADNFIAYAEDMLGIARRLDSQGIDISFQECSHTHFGRWVVVAGVDRERFRFEWDGRSLAFTISEITRAKGLPDWLVIRTLNLQCSEALSAMETFLREKFQV